MHGLKFATSFLILLLHGQVNPLPNLLSQPLTSLLNPFPNLLGPPPTGLADTFPNILTLPLRPFQEFVKRIVDPLVKTALDGNIHFILYNRENPEGKILVLLNNDTLYPRTDKELKVLISGYQTDEGSEMPQTLKDAYLATRDVNIIYVDWRRMSKSPIYLLASRAVFVLGECVALLLSRIYEQEKANTNTNVINVHLIGHSLGAHAVGATGRSLKQKTGQIPYRITGLDPANPQVDVSDPLGEEILTVTDAPFVDVIHSSKLLGANLPIGHADFFPNGGMDPQPGCSLFPLTMFACSHSASWKYYAESIRNPAKYLALRCISYRAFNEGQCDDRAYMGEGVSPLANGTYYLLTST